MENRDMVVVGVICLLLLFVVAMFLLLRGKSEELQKVVLNDSTEIQMVSSTEYSYGDEGMIVVTLRNSTYDSIISAICNVTILYPNRDYYVALANMSIGNITMAAMGSYYYNFTVPYVEGVYEYQAVCYIGDRHYTVGRSFHVSGFKGINAWTTK
jgi:hypothetical protein